ncbi:MAG TPA: MarR family transcriptional regulator, partial [Clostridiales bacterium]|nr:MarR family transcriptional regulator [Clostridiales bacterium]
MNELEQKAYIFATIFTFSNRLQALGDEFDKKFTTKQWLFILAVSRFKEPPTITEVANFIGYSRQNAKRIAADL